MAKSKTASKKKSALKSMGARNDITALLTADHRAVKKLYRQYEKLVDAEADAQEREAIASEICEALTAHATAEEEVFYTAVREAIDEDAMMDEADIEHASAKDLIEQIQAMHPDEDKYDARVIVLCEYINHHVKEEEGEMFRKARRTRGLDLKDLGEKFLQRKAQLLSQPASAGRRKAMPEKNAAASRSKKAA